MTKEKFKKYIEKSGGIEELVEFREKIMELVCAIDGVIELEATIDSIEISEEEILEKVTDMLLSMEILLTQI